MRYAVYTEEHEYLEQRGGGGPDTRRKLHWLKAKTKEAAIKEAFDYIGPDGTGEYESFDQFSEWSTSAAEILSIAGTEVLDLEAWFDRTKQEEEEQARLDEIEEAEKLRKNEEEKELREFERLKAKFEKGRKI